MKQIFNTIFWFNDYAQVNKTIILLSILLIMLGIGIFFVIDFNIWNKTGRSLWNKGSKQKNKIKRKVKR